MALPSIAQQKLDVFDVIMGGERGFDPATCPLFSLTHKGPDSPEAALFQFVFDEADEPSATGSAEGGQWSQASVTSFGNPSRLYGRMHHKKYHIGAGEVSEGDKGYAMGGLSLFQYHTKRAMRKLVRDIELIILGAQENQAGDDSTAYVTRGLELYILNTALIALQTDTATVIPADFRPAEAQVKEVTAGTGDFDFAETDLVAMADAAYNSREGRVKWRGYCTSRLKSKISAWGNLAPQVASHDNIRRFNYEAEDKKIIRKIQTWEGDSADIELEQHPFLRKNTSTQKAEGLFIDPDYVMMRVRMQPSVQKMADDSGVKRAYGMATMGVQCVPKFLGQVRRLAA